MKDRHIVELERQVRQMHRELRRLRRAAVLGLIVMGVGILFIEYTWLMLGLTVLVLAFGVFSAMILSVVLGGGVAMAVFDHLYYKWLRRRFRRKDALLRAEQIRMRHSGLSLKSLVG